MQVELNDAVELIKVDIELATTSGLPVLVTGPSHWADSVVLKIAAQRRQKVKVVWCGRTGGRPVAADVASTARDVIVWTRDIDELDRTGQGELSEVLLGRSRAAGAGRPQIIASSNDDLFSRVRAAEFDDALFYALNAIHIWIPSGA